MSNSNKELFKIIIEKLENLDKNFLGLKNEVLDLKGYVSDLKGDISDLKGKFDFLDEKLERYIKRDADISEFEITQTLYKYLDKYPQTKIIPKNFIKIIKNPFTNQVITDLNGVIILTNSQKLINKYKNNYSELPNFNYIQEYKKIVKPKQENNLSNKIFIVEAKRVMTKEKVIKKLKQYEELKNYLTIIKNLKKDDFQNEKKYKRFLRTIELNNLNDFKPDNLYLILGSSLWDRDIRKVIPNNPKIKLISLSGNRYEITHNSSINKYFNNHIIR